MAKQFQMILYSSLTDEEETKVVSSPGAARVLCANMEVGDALTINRLEDIKDPPWVPHLHTSSTLYTGNEGTG